MQETPTKPYDSEQFSQIISPSRVDISLFVQACQGQDLQQVADFIETVLKILKLHDKPGRADPLKQLLPQELLLLILELHRLRQRLKLTVYELKVRKIIQALEHMAASKEISVPKQPGPDYKKVLGSIKIQEVIADPKILMGKFEHPQHLYDFCIKEVLPAAGRSILAISEHDRRYEEVKKALALCELLIHPTELEVHISKNTLLETRTFQMKYESAFQAAQTSLMGQSARIVNEALLCPSDAKVQGSLLRLLKRMYRLWGEPIQNPLYLNLRNISLFMGEGQESTKVVKQAAIFCYSVINSKTDIKFADLLASSQDLGGLKKNEFFSSKGMALPFQLHVSCNTMNLELPSPEYKVHIDKRETYCHPVCIEKTNTLLFWSVSISGYDIGVGLYKVSSLRRYQMEQLSSGEDCKAVVKMGKVGAGSKMPARGHLFLKTGLYYLVLDNSYSIVRGKEVLLQVCQLETAA